MKTNSITKILTFATLGGLLWAQDTHIKTQPVLPESNITITAPAGTGKVVELPVVQKAEARRAQTEPEPVVPEEPEVPASRTQYINVDINGLTTTFEADYTANGHDLSVSVGDAYSFEVDVEFPVVDEENLVDSATLEAELNRMASERTESSLGSLTTVIFKQMQDGNGNGTTSAAVNHKEGFFTSLVAYIKGGKNGQRNEYHVEGRGSGAYEDTFVKPTETISDTETQTLQETPEAGY